MDNEITRVIFKCKYLCHQYYAVEVQYNIIESILSLKHVTQMVERF